MHMHILYTCKMVVWMHSCNAQSILVNPKDIMNLLLIALKRNQRVQERAEAPCIIMSVCKINCSSTVLNPSSVATELTYSTRVEIPSHWADNYCINF